MMPDDLLHLGLVHAERGRAGRPHADPARGERRQRVERDRVLVQRDADLVAHGLGVGAGDPERPQVDEREVRVRPAARPPEGPPPPDRRASARAVRTTRAA